MTRYEACSNCYRTVDRGQSDHNGECPECHAFLCEDCVPLGCPVCRTDRRVGAVLPRPVITKIDEFHLA